MTKQSLEIQAARAFEFYRHNFWRFAKYLKTEDQQRGLVRSFPVCGPEYVDDDVNADAVVYPHLGPLYDSYRAKRLDVWLKSRRTFATNACCGWTFHEAFRCDKTRGEAYLAGFSADHEDKSAAILDRIRLMHTHLPEWLRVINPITRDTRLELRFRLGGRILAFSSNPARYRSEGFTRVNADEFAFHPDGYEALPAMLGTVVDGGQVCVLSTPNGRANAYYELCSGQRDPNIKPTRIHWREIPGRDDAWKAKVMSEMMWTPADWAREMEHSFDVALGPRMFEEFDYVTHVKSLGERIPDGVQFAICGWDIGFECPAAVIMYLNKHDQLVVHCSIAGHRPDGGFAAFIREVKEFRRAVFPRDVWVDYTPHDTVNTSKETGTNYREIFEEKGIYPEINTNKKPEIGWDFIRKMLTLRADGLPGLIVNEDGTYFTQSGESPVPELRNVALEGFQGSFTRRQQKVPEGVRFLDEPNRQHPFIDVMDALNCAVTMFFKDRPTVDSYDWGDEGVIHQPRI